jgi:hypothetical protein
LFVARPTVLSAYQPGWIAQRRCAPPAAVADGHH